LKERHYPIVPTYNDTRMGVMLVAMILRHAIDISVAYAAEGGSTIAPPKDMVLTVPSYATMAERRALLDATTLADINVLALMDENTAAALHYAMDKNFEGEKEQILLFYNLGAAALQISIIRFFNYDQPQKFGKPKSTPALEVLGKSWDATCGGDAFDHIIVEFMADQFNEAYKTKHPTQTDFDVRHHTRPMTKLRIQANKVKHVLSANVDIPIYVDGVYEDLPLQTHLTRTQFEALAATLVERATVAPIQQALQVANLTWANLTGIELLGGGMRIPRIQQELQALLPPNMELGYHINSDESFALGAAFGGANISTAFRVRPVGMTDINPFPIGVTLTNMLPTNDSNNDDDDDEAKAWSKSATIFKAFGKVGVKKTIAFTHTHNIHCGLDYLESDVLPPGTELGLVRYNITGVPEFMTEIQTQYNLTTKPKISLQFELSTSGLVSLIKAEAAVEETYTIQEEIEVEEDDNHNNNSTTMNATTKAANSEANTTNDNVVKENATSANATANETTTNATTANETAAKPKRKILVDKVSFT
jgi:hypoxia up-regulated 1